MSAFYRAIVLYLVLLFASLALAHVAASYIEAQLLAARSAPAQPAAQGTSTDDPAPRANGARKGQFADPIEHDAGAAVRRRPTGGLV